MMTIRTWVMCRYVCLGSDRCRQSTTSSQVRRADEIHLATKEVDRATDWYVSCNTKGILLPYSSDESDESDDEEAAGNE